MINFQCSGCDKQFQAKYRDAGRKTRCPNCGKRLVVPEPPPEKMLVIQPPADENDVYGLIEDDNYRPPRTPSVSSGATSESSSDDGLLVIQPPANKNDVYELANDGKADPRKCPSCNSELADEVIVCITCGYDHRSGEQLSQQLEGNSWRAVNKLRLLLGTTTSIMAGLMLAFVWVLVAKTTGREFVWAAVFIGLACGYQMATVSRVNHFSAGILAACTTLLCLLPEKSLMFQQAMIFLVNLMGSTDEEFVASGFWNQFELLDWLFGFLAITISIQVGMGKTQISQEPQFEDV